MSTSHITTLGDGPSLDIGSIFTKGVKALVTGEDVGGAIQGALTQEGRRICMEGFFQEIRTEWPTYGAWAFGATAALVGLGFWIGRHYKTLPR